MNDSISIISAVCTLCDIAELKNGINEIFSAVQWFSYFGKHFWWKLQSTREDSRWIHRIALIIFELEWILQFFRTKTTFCWFCFLLFFLLPLHWQFNFIDLSSQFCTTICSLQHCQVVCWKYFSFLSGL